MPDERHQAILNASEEEHLAARIASSLEAAMSVEPSADFLARVRRRVGEQRARSETVMMRGLSAAAAPVVIALVVVGAAVLRRAPAELGDSGPARTQTAVQAPALTPRPVVPAPRPRVLRAVAAPSRPKPALAAEVRVEPGQLEALAQVAVQGLRAPSQSPFVIESLDQQALPELRPESLPRFVAVPLAVRSGGGQEPRTDAGWVSPIGEEGSGS
jgi:hypothetical protein